MPVGYSGLPRSWPASTKKRKGRPSRPRRSAACSTASRGAGCGLTVTGSSKAASYSADAGFTCARRQPVGPARWRTLSVFVPFSVNR